LKQSTPSQQGQALVESARIRLGQGDHAGAIRQLEEALAVAPELNSARHLLLVTYLENGQATRALGHLVAGLGKQPNDPFLLVVRTRMALDRGDAQEAAASARDALGRHPENDSLHGLLALSLLASGQAEAAIAHFQRALANDPLSPTGLIGLAAALEQGGQTAVARQALLRARGSGRLSPTQQTHVDSRLTPSGP
jgi:predicted Zn-dependent protease